MRYLDTLINASFKERNSNSSIFFPYGKFSSGYIFFKEDEVKVKRFLRKYYLVTFVSTITTVILFGNYALFLLFILLPGYFVKVNKILKGKEKTLVKYRMSESMNTMAISMGLPMCYILFLGNVLLFVVSIFVLVKSDNKMLGLSSLLFFGFGLLISFRLLFTSTKYHHA